VPACVKVIWYEAPFASESDVKATGDPASETMVCAAPSWFVQVTVVPVLTVMVAGLNVKSLIVTAFVPPAAAGTGVASPVVTGPVFDVQPANEPARISRMIHAAGNRSLACAGINPQWRKQAKKVCMLIIAPAPMPSTEMLPPYPLSLLPPTSLIGNRPCTGKNFISPPIRKERSST
jgi:hypothetical protein